MDSKQHRGLSSRYYKPHKKDIKNERKKIKERL
jgi:hypothetical protein